MPKKTQAVKQVPLNHLAIICDGNRRWARAKGKVAWAGYWEAEDTLKMILETCRDLKIKYISLWTFNTATWKRDKREVSELIKLHSQMFDKYEAYYLKHQIRFQHIGRKDRLPAKLVAQINRLEEKTSKFTRWHLLSMIDYGGRDEIVRAAQKFAQAVQSGQVKVEDLTESSFDDYLDTKNIPAPDLIIRTGQEFRLSGMYPFQGAYSELYLLDKLFPDMNRADLEKAVKEYYQRQRRFGGG